MIEKIVLDLDFAKEYLKINESELSSLLNVPRSSLNNWRKGKTKISLNQYEKVYSFLYSQGIRINSIKSQIYKDKETNNKKIIYHGAKKEIEGDISLQFSKENNDFGKGFYLGEDLYQASSFVSKYSNSSVYICEFNNKNLKKKTFNVDENWMLLVAYFRGRLTKYKESKKLIKLIREAEKCDYIIAPIADNNMYQIIDSFVKGDITDLQCINSLSASDLGKQYVMLTNKALKNLTIKERCYLCNEERSHYENIKNDNYNNGLQKVKFAMRKYAGKGKYIEELL